MVPSQDSITVRSPGTVTVQSPTTKKTAPKNESQEIYASPPQWLQQSESEFRHANGRVELLGVASPDLLRIQPPGLRDFWGMWRFLWGDIKFPEKCMYLPKDDMREERESSDPRLESLESERRYLGLWKQNIPLLTAGRCGV